MAEYLNDKAKCIMHVTAQHSIKIYTSYEIKIKTKMKNKNEVGAYIFKDQSRISRSDVKNN